MNFKFNFLPFLQEKAQLLSLKMITFWSENDKILEKSVQNLAKTV